MSAARGWRRWVLSLLRLAVCAGAIAYLVTKVEWHDHLQLADAGHTRVRIVERVGPPGDPTAYVVRHTDGRTERISPEQIHQTELGGRTVPDIDLGVPSVVLQMDARWAALALLLFGPVPLLSSVRLVWMLAMQNVRLSLSNAIKLTFAGNFFNFALPGTTGGDIYKAWCVTRLTEHKTEAVTAIFLDRAIGLFSLIIVAGAMIPFEWNPDRFGRLVVVLGVIFASLMIGAVLVFSRRLRHAIRLPQLAAMLPMGQHLLRIGRATVAMRAHKSLVLGALLLTLCLQVMVMISAWAMSRALGMDGGLSYYFIGVSLGFLVAAIPISPPQAIGIMEAAYVQFFVRAPLENTASQAVALALAVRLIQLAWALPGVLVPLAGAFRPRRRELDSFEADGAADAPGGSPLAAATPTRTVSP